jgi:hypothetical protein
MLTVDFFGRPKVRTTEKSGSLGLILLLVFAVVVFVALVPSWKCVPSILDAVLETGELDPPLPAGCVPTSQSASPETIHALDIRREGRELELERTFTCKIAAAHGGKNKLAADSGLDNLYIDGTLEYQRFVFFAKAEDIADGRLVAIEISQVPRWRYLKRLGGRCEAEL